MPAEKKHIARSSPSLTEHQLEAWYQLMAFLQESNQQVFILKGYAGTGKTFLLRKLVEHLQEEGTHAPVMMAPTGRAAEVLRRVTRVEARTIHSQLYGRPSIESGVQDSIQLTFPLVYPDLPGPTLWVVDEASMLTDARSDSEGMRFGSGSLLNDLISATRLSHRPEDRLLFVGDPAQLPPVAGGEFSPALEADYLRARYRLVVNECELTQVMRQLGDSGILNASLHLRKAMQRRGVPGFRLPEGPGLTAINWGDFDQHFPLLELEHQPLSVIVLTHTNDQAYRINQVVRRMRYQAQSLPIQPGDWLMVDRNFYAGDHIIYNGTHVRVLEVGDSVEERHVALRGKQGQPGSLINLSFRNVTIEAPHPETSQMFTLEILLLENSVLQPRRLGVKDQQALVVDFRKRNPDWQPDHPEAAEKLLRDPYFNALQARYGYAITVHKAQGGEWSDVFVNFAAAFPRKSRQMFRWAYTAVTRARERMFGLDLPLFSELPPVNIEQPKVLKKVGPEARYFPTLPPSPELPEIFLKLPFLVLRHKEIQNLARKAGLDVSMSAGESCLSYEFSDGKKSTYVDLPFDEHGMTRPRVPKKGGRALKDQVRSLIFEQPLYAVPGIPPPGPRRIWYEQIRAEAADYDWGLSNYLKKKNKDVYWFKTGTGFVRLDLVFDQTDTPVSIQPFCEAEALDEWHNWLRECPFAS